MLGDLVPQILTVHFSMVIAALLMLVLGLESDDPSGPALDPEFAAVVGH